jgi:hypothetical protein
MPCGLIAGANIKLISMVPKLKRLFFLFFKNAFLLFLYSIYFQKIYSNYG